MIRFARSKYHAKKAEYAGENYDSKAEAAYAKHLDSLIERGDILWYLRQPRFWLGVPENRYVGDFLVVAKNWVCVDDVKGVETPAFKRNVRLWRSYGRLPLRIIKPKLRYAKKGSDDLPSITGVDFVVVQGGSDRRPYGPLHPEWIRR